MEENFTDLTKRHDAAQITSKTLEEEIVACKKEFTYKTEEFSKQKELEIEIAKGETKKQMEEQFQENVSRPIIHTFYFI